MMKRGVFVRSKWPWPLGVASDNTGINPAWIGALADPAAPDGQPANPSDSVSQWLTYSGGGSRSIVATVTRPATVIRFASIGATVIGVSVDSSHMTVLSRYSAWLSLPPIDVVAGQYVEVAFGESDAIAFYRVEFV